uniref:Uncharacterized protein n=1 Tax=viral metagenome TaxID=1070528 RepID=A0A6H2A2A8_9ZZZZ
MKNKVLIYENCSITISAGDRIIYNKKYGSTDKEAAPFWGGQYGHIKGTVLSYSNEEYIKKFGKYSYPLRILWDNGKINGFELPWIPHFTIISPKQLNLFQGV